MSAPPPLDRPALGAETVFSNQDLITLLGGGAGILAMLGLLLLLPLYLTHRREIGRLLAWKDREPDAGTTEFRAIAGPAPEAPPPSDDEAARPVADAPPPGPPGPPPPEPPGPVRPPARVMTPAERVTSERPALARVSTAEYAAIELERAALWRRVLIGGPRHPAVLSVLALIVAAAVIFAAAQLIRSNGPDSQRGGRLDRSAVSVVVANASDSPGLGGEVADRLSAERFTVDGTTASSEPARKTAVLYGAGSKPAAKAVSRSLGLNPKDVMPYDTKVEAAADGADVVVLAAADVAKPAGADVGKPTGAGRG